MQMLLIYSAKTAVVLLFLFVAFRLLGKRQAGQLNIYDLAMVMALANAVQNAMTGGSGNLAVGMVTSATLIGLGWLITQFVVHTQEAEKYVIGMPTVIVSKGMMLGHAMRRQRVTEDELETAVRQHGLTDVKEVKMAVLEVDGSISVIPKKPH